MLSWDAAVFVNVSYMTDNLVPEGYYSQSLGVCVRIKTGNPHMIRYWYDAFLVFLLVLGVDSWLAIAPVDLQSRIEHYVLAPLLIVFALVMLLLWAGLYDR